MARTTKGLTIQELVHLLDDPGFCADAKAFHEEARRQHERYPSPQEWREHWPKFIEQVLTPFVHKWGALPPPGDLVGSDPRKRQVLAILGGRWGLIPVFPWTGDREIRRSVGRIRRAIGRLHRDATGRMFGQIAAWLRQHMSPGQGPPPRREIARSLRQRKKGLRRPTLRYEEEQELIRRYKEQGMTRREQVRRVYKKTKYREAPAEAMARMAERRYESGEADLHGALESPQEADPLSHALTMLLREIIYGSGNLDAIREKSSRLQELLAELPSQD